MQHGPSSPQQQRALRAASGGASGGRGAGQPQQPQPQQPHPGQQPGGGASGAQQQQRPAAPAVAVPPRQRKMLKLVNPETGSAVDLEEARKASAAKVGRQRFTPLESVVQKAC